MMKTLHVFLGSALLLGGVLTGCASDPGALQGDDSVDPNNTGPGTNPDGTNPQDQNADPAQTCPVGQAYVGFAGTKLETGRVEAVIGADRSRVKPYSALSGEYTRVLGAQPASLAGAAATFGQPANRWYVEPQASAISLYTAYSVAFDGCLTYTGTDAKYTTAPSQATASTECAAMTRKFWSRTASTDEVNACVKVAVTDTASITDAKRRWAHTCASVMTASGFLAY